MDNILTVVIAIYSIYLLLKLYISVVQIAYVKEHKLKKSILMHQGDFIKSAEYEEEKQKLSIVSSFVEYILFFYWVSSGFRVVNELLLMVDNGLLKAVLFVNIVVTINFFATLPLDIYEKYVIDNKYGFNKTPIKLFVVDTVKSGILYYVFGSLVIFAVAYFIQEYQYWWLVSFLFVFFVIVIINMIYPTIIAPIFNKFSVLSDKELNSKIEQLLSKVGFKSSGIFTIDASKRDTRLNAYFGGLGNSKRVVLFDTLIQKLSHNELLAVLAHELGHFKHGDIYKNIFITGGIMFVLFFILGNLPNELFYSMGVEKDSATLISTFLIIVSPIAFFLMPIINYISRKNEFNADKFSTKLQDSKDLKNALVKLVSENKKFPLSHPLYMLFYYTHPSVLERIEAMGGMEDSADSSTDSEFSIFDLNSNTN